MARKKMGHTLVSSGLALLISIFAFFIFSGVSFADSDYVLPYPSAMPGSKMYFLHKIEERISKYWYFGDYGSFTYNRQLSDKYLVEAKTLFEYKQYVLALQSLSTTNNYFRQMQSSLKNTPPKKYGKKEKVDLMKHAAEKHLEILRILGLNLPKDFLWQEEKENARLLNIAIELNHAASIRKESL